MIHRILFIACLMSSASLFAQDHHVGTWQNNDHGDIGYVKLSADGFAWFIINNVPEGGPSFWLAGDSCSMTYTTNYQVIPHTIDLSITNLSTHQVVEKHYGIFAMKTDYRTLYLCIDLYRKGRPEDFEEEYTMVLSRLWED